ncbi:coiled-coil domain-containing protein 103-like [Mya arenaria]|uniref:coiled-coil domain-containing protein 103-like n=1 Tax=Mya arenaria TaxID=6604 RepID=UPI0022E22895|nr:coiled-coil domain-containing protein 103-like [Mya arenaria]
MSATNKGEATMISHDDDKAINFKRLEQELENAVEGEARYWRENDAKFRAVHQKVATYDEFRDIVKASHLKPLEKEDKLTDIKFIQPWNSQANKRQEDGNKKATEDIPKGKEYPTSGQAFIREWRRFNKDTTQQYDYLIELGGEQLRKIFKPEIGFGLLGEFANCLDCELKNEDFKNVINILQELCETNRFSLTVQFLSSKEKGYLNSLVVKLKNMASDVENFESEVLTDLQTKYEIKQ